MLEFLDLLDPNHANFNPENVCYLRSTHKNFRKKAANFQDDFPEIVEDINLCPENVSDSGLFLKTFSTILRMSSSTTQIWTHYDTINNFLMQIVGSKQVFLAPPDHAKILKLKVDSDKPDIFDPFEQPENLGTAVELQPGDVLFLPSHWFHATRVINQNFSISVNHFWQQIDPEQHKNFYDKKDLYGNKPPKPAQEIEEMAEKIHKLLDTLPNDDIKNFYREKAHNIIDAAEYF